MRGLLLSLALVAFVPTSQAAVKDAKKLEAFCARKFKRENDALKDSAAPLKEQAAKFVKMLGDFQDCVDPANPVNQ